MAPFYPVYIRRSDGKLEIKSKSGKELNEPLPSQLDTKPNTHGISDFYRECPPGETKEVDWRRKLGGMLMREIGGKDTKDRNYILAAFPENYRVYEHVKCQFSEVDGKPTKVTKNHAAAGTERQDAYLYGHPSGRKKRYRSPAEFFPHLLWLATDESGDTNNCSCKFCSPEEIESDEKPPTKAVARDVKQEAVSKPQDIQGRLARTASTSAPLPVRRTSQQGTQQPQFSNLPAPLPRQRSPEQRLDSQYNQFIYRPGEIAWFQKAPAAWGLGVVIQRSSTQSYNIQQYQYLIQPLSHPNHHLPTKLCPQDNLRPWLAWSPPPCTCAELNPTPNNHNRVYTFETVDWVSVINGRYGPGDPEVDGSILAAKAVDSTFTLFDRIDAKMSTPGTSQVSEISYNGLYLGGEKIWLGDPLRLRTMDSPSDIMVLQAIIERPNSQNLARPVVTLVGDIYSLKPKIPHDSMVDTEAYLPLRVREDLRVRNSITRSAPVPTINSWRFLSRSVRMKIADIKGRWYETSLLMPILDENTFNTSRQNGEIGDVGLWMNGQGDCNRPPNAPQGSFKPADVKARRREDAFGRSVPSAFKISGGLDEMKQVPSATRDVRMGDRASTPQSTLQPRMPPDTALLQPPRPQSSQPLSQNQILSQIARSASPYVDVPPMPDGGFDQYMKFDDTDVEQEAGGLGGFGQQYGVGDLGHGFFNSDQMQH